MNSQFGISISFDQSIKDILYKEGVYPTQGARPLLTTIQTLLKSRISIYLSTIIKNCLNTDHLHLFLTNEQELNCEFYSNELLEHTQKDLLVLQLEPLRKPKHDELQTIVAVHESGHAILSAALMYTIPELVVSVTSDADNLGYVYCKNNKILMTKDEIIRKAAVHLGGMIAEELVFGKEMVTTGGSNDLANATKIIMAALKQEGMGTQTVAFSMSIDEISLLYHQVDSVEQEALILLEESRQLAFRMLEKEMTLLLVMSEHLSVNSRMDNKEIKAVFEQYMLTSIPEESEKFKYRKKLKERLEILKGDKQNEIISIQTKDKRA